MPLPQIITIVSISALTVLAIVIGIEMLLLIKSIRSSLTRLNDVIDTAETAIEHLAQPAAGMIAIIEGLKQSGKIVEVLSGFLGKVKKDDQYTALE